MANVRDIKRRIRSVKNIAQVTRAMQMVAASKMRRAQEQVLATRPYSAKAWEVLTHLAAQRGSDHGEHPLLARRDPITTTGIVLITSDKGLCGAYNGNIIRKAMAYIESLPRDSARLVIIGKKANDFFKRRPFEILKYWSFPSRDVEVSFVAGIGRFLAEGYEKADFDRVVMFYTKFKSAMVTTPLQVGLLPFESAEGEEDGGASALYIFEPGAEELMGKLLPKYLQNQIYLALVEAAASEHGSRMVSMKNATDNCDEMIRNLTLAYNKMRQASITGELLEVVAGADATAKE